jgi:hypothetical protein
MRTSSLRASAEESGAVFSALRATSGNPARQQHNSSSHGGIGAVKRIAVQR